jgi:hypothetical protein
VPRHDNHLLPASSAVATKSSSPATSGLPAALPCGTCEVQKVEEVSEVGEVEYID